ncbi:hypothetical protein IIA15_05515 [candidate division TA06 bacterium]|nr:hypothetical protein [candidate division TA06 bacterium]
MKGVVRILRTTVRIGMFLSFIVFASASAQSQEGEIIIVLSDTSDVTVSHVDANAVSNNIFGLFSPRTETLWFCLDADSGFTVNLGRFPIGTEVIFFLHNPRPGYEGTFFTGPAERNPDGVVHAIITEVGFQTWQIEWEDWLGGGDRSYDDCVCEIKGDLLISPVGVEGKNGYKQAVNTGQLLLNQPNPFSQMTEIRYQLTNPHHVVLRIYDMSGRQIITLGDGMYKPGDYIARWDGRDEKGEEVSNGVYLYRMDARRSPDTDGFIMTNKLILLR